jgi:hypothetical protein
VTSFGLVSVANFRKRKTLLRSSALIAMTCLLLNIWGCVCFQPVTKVEPDPTTGKEVVKQEELPLACKIFWISLGAIGTAFTALNWFSTDESEKRRKTAEKNDGEYKKAMDALPPKDK